MTAQHVDVGPYANGFHSDDPGPPEPPPEPRGDVKGFHEQVTDKAFGIRVGRAATALVDLEDGGIEEIEYRREGARRKAKARHDALNTPPLRTLTFSQFLDSKGAEPYVHGLFYRASNHRLYGPPGGGKSLMMLDIGLRAALGWEWSGVPIIGGPVVYVMAEGQRVNHDRTLAWLDYYRVSQTDRERLEDRFLTVPDAVMLTEEAAKPFVEYVRRIQPSLIILDTKNRMMIGEENNASDWRPLLAVLDSLQGAAGDAAVVLIDHTGHDADRPRGSTAGTGGMETEVRVREEKGGVIQAVVTRDKSGGDGFIRDFRIHVHETLELPERTRNQPVLVPSVGPAAAATVDLDALADETESWRKSEVELPDAIKEFEGKGATRLAEVARFMATEVTAVDGDPSRIGVSRAEVAKALGVKNNDSSLRRAWSWLIDKGYLRPGTKSTAPTGRHFWSAPDMGADGPVTEEP